MGENLLSLSEAVKRTAVSSRVTLAKYIKNHRFDDWAKDKIRIYRMNNDRNYYQISEEWIQEFNKRHARGELSPSKKDWSEMAFSVSELVDYCAKHDIKTIKEFEEDVKIRLKKLRN